MRTSIPFFLALLLLLSSCSYRQFGAVATGSSLGGMLGSSIGGLMGGYRGADKGTVAGMLIGGAIGAVVTTTRNAAERSEAEGSYDSATEGYEDYSEYDNYSHSRSYKHDDPVTYGTYNSPRYRNPAAEMSDLSCIDVSNIRFLDANNNRQLDSGEEATIVMDVYNRGSKTLYNVTPHICCNNRRVVVSPAATVESIRPGGGIRYKTTVRAAKRLRGEELRFTVTFGTGRQAVEVSTFCIASE